MSRKTERQPHSLSAAVNKAAPQAQAQAAQAEQQLPPAAAPPEQVITDEMRRRINASTGRGVSSAAGDNLVPLIKLLQPLSPEVNPRSPQHVPGAEPGDILLRNAPNPVVKGEQGFLFQPCYYEKKWTEWVPRERGGGFVAQYDNDDKKFATTGIDEPLGLPPGAQKWIDPENRNRVIYRHGGNDIIMVRRHPGFVLDEGLVLPFVLAFTSSGHTVSRNWMFMMNGFLNENGDKMDSWLKKYRFTARVRKNAKGEWYVFSPQPMPGVVSEADMQRGEALYTAFASGEKKSEIGEQLDNDDRSSRADTM